MSDSGGGDSYVGGELTARSARPQQQCFEVVEEAKGQWMRVLQQLEFDGVEWRAWTEFRQWERDEEGREIEDEGEFRQALCEKYRMSKEKLNCILTLGLYAGGREEKAEPEKERHGLGKSLFPNGDTFEGQLEHGKRSGFGIYVWNSIRPHRLDRKIFSFHKKWLAYTEGQQERGEAYEDRNAFVTRLSKSLKVHPERIVMLLERKNGHPFYEGYFLNNLKHGEGVLKNPDGSVYIGQFEEGERSGLGYYIFPNSDTYTGGWKAGKKHGEGVYEFFGKNCAYEGLWEEGELLRGRWVFCDGTSYEGSFLDTTPKPKLPAGGEEEEEEEEPEDEEQEAITVRKTFPHGDGVFVFPHINAVVEGHYDAKFMWRPSVTHEMHSH